jgi:hypothetical protein
MRKSAVLAAALVLCRVQPLPAGLPAANVIIQWDNVVIDNIRATGGPPCPIARASAMVHVAMYDAVNSIDRTHDPYKMFVPGPAGASREAAAAAAAHRVLTVLYPARKEVFDGALAESLAGIPDGASETAGVALGKAVADGIIAFRSDDGTATDPPYPIGSNPGEWRPTFPDFTSPPFNPGWGATKPWTMISGSMFRPGGPSGYTNLAALLASTEYSGMVNEVKTLGARNSAVRTPYETETAWFWANDRNGTFKPPGHLNYITGVIAAGQGLSLSETARLFALVNLAMADAGLVAWDVKYRTDIDLWRPISAIREAASDGNAATEADPEWEPLNPFTPPFPAYISGHATFAAAHAAVLRGFFGRDDITFNITSDDTPGVFRTYHSLDAAARENGRSRIFLGVHYQFDADDGYQSGTALGDYVVKQHLRKLTPFIRGDANRSGDLDLADSIWILNELFIGGPSTKCAAAADCNGDGKRDVSDALHGISFQFLGGPPPAPPFPACGQALDSTPDSCSEGSSSCS